MNGFLNLYKESGFTSHDCVAKLRRIFGQKKIGHMGTLDPDAEGVLPVALGKATRLIELFDDEYKTYRVTMLLGITTDTLDVTGTVLDEKEVCASEEEVRQCLFSFLGKSMQIPPMYSALKKDGKRLYELAREGKEVEREAREITVYALKISKLDLPRVCFDVTVSRGTYIRSICDDAGRRLGCGACMEKLERTEVGRFCAKDSFKLRDLEMLAEKGSLSAAVRPMTDAFPGMPVIHTRPEADTAAHNGNAVYTDRLEANAQEAERFWLFDSGNRPVGIYIRNKNRCTPLKMVYEEEN